MVNGLCAEKELLQPVSLCGPDGRLNPDAIGWSRRSFFDCNLSGRWPRKKRWNYWAFMSTDCLFSVTVSSLDYAGMAFMYFYDFNTHMFYEKTFLTPLGKGCFLQQAVDQPVQFKHAKARISMQKENNHSCIEVTCSDFFGEPLSANLQVIYPENYDTLNVVIPWSESTFQFTSKHAGMSVAGSLKLGSRQYVFEPDTSFASLDFGRGIWPRKVDWNWATFSGMMNGKRIGINLGARWTDHTGMTENAFIVNGVLEKISEDVVFEYDTSNYMKDWRIYTASSDRIDLVFHPEYERVAKSNAILVRSELHQMMGYVSGTMKYGEDILELKQLLGCVEDHHTIW